MLSIQKITKREELESLKPIWNKILNESDNDVLFLTYEWIAAFWDSFGSEKELLILLVKEEGKIIGIAPLMSYRERMWGQNLRIVSLIANAHTCQSGFIVTSKHKAVTEATLNFLHKDYNNWDVLDLDFLQVGSSTYNSVKNIAKEKNLMMGETDCLSSPFLTIEGDWDSYLAKKRSKDRNEMKRRIKKLKELKEDFRIIIDNHKLDDHILCNRLEKIYQIVRNSWAYTNKKSIISSETIKKYYEKIAEHANNNSWLYLGLLEIGDQPAAFEFNIRYNRKIYNLKVGYDENYSTLGVGKILKVFMLENCFNDDVVEYDLLGMDDPYKMLWAESKRQISRIFIFNDKFYPRLIYYNIFVFKPFLKRVPFLKETVRRIKQLTSNI